MQNSHYHEWVTRNVTCPISFTDSTSIEETIERITKSAGEQIKYEYDFSPSFLGQKC